jgi:hypothetical protein
MNPLWTKQTARRYRLNPGVGSGHFGLDSEVST